MKVHLTKVSIVISKKNDKRYLKVCGIKPDGELFSGMCEAPEVTPEVDLTQEEIAQFSSHDLRFGVGFDGSARLESVQESEA